MAKKGGKVEKVDNYCLSKTIANSNVFGTFTTSAFTFSFTIAALITFKPVQIEGFSRSTAFYILLGLRLNQQLKAKMT